MAAGLDQTSQYADKCEAEEARLVIFDRRDGIARDDKICRAMHDFNGRSITAWGMWKPRAAPATIRQSRLHCHFQSRKKSQTGFLYDLPFFIANTMVRNVPGVGRVAAPAINQ